jgi:transcriptional regulator MraZ
MERAWGSYNGGCKLQSKSYPGDTNLLLGLYTCILETDNRLILPDNFRGHYKDGLYLTQGFDRNIMVLTKPAFEVIYKRITSFNLADPVARLLLRMLLGSVHIMELEANGGIRIPDKLKELASLEQTAMVVGQGDFIELWSPEEWDRQEARLREMDADRFSTLTISTQSIRPEHGGSL